MKDDFYKELDALYESGTPQQVEQFLSRKAEAYNNAQPRHLDGYIAAMNELGSFYRGRGRFAESVEVFLRAKTMWEATSRKDDQSYAILLNNLAGTYRMDGENGKALSLYLQSLAIYENLSSYDAYSHASLLNNIALVYEQTGDTAKAIDYTQQAMEEMVDLNPIAYAISSSNLASLLLREGKEEDAKAAVRQALNIFTQNQYEDDPHFAAALNVAAFLDVVENNYAGAIEKYRRAADITKSCNGENNDFITICMNLSKTCMRMGQAAEAERYYQIALAAAQTLYGETSEHFTKIKEENPLAGEEA